MTPLSAHLRVAHTRGEVVESVHAVSVVVLRPDGTVLRTAGDPAAPVYGRSALKPAQAVAVLRAGADLTDDEVALAAASHSGEPVHLAAVTALLGRHGLTPDDLRCVEDLPLGAAAMRAYLTAGHGPTRLAMNCSGKHAAMLVAAGGDPDYLEPTHPLQQACRAAVDELAGPVLGASVDGCGAPAFVTPLEGLARLAHALARPADPAVARVAAAMRGRPDLVAGTDRLDTVLMTELPGCVAKSGAEGVLVAALPDGTAVAAKVADGAGRALGPTLLAVLDTVGVAVPAALRAVAAPPVVGKGRPVGEMQVRWPDDPDG
ncbi:asparaginase [Actinomycetospora corticicola]|uniref:L-asparaginase II n=1 Tax=Actinomycetospora corticicola TaxID=663602 RepID=A0A7Y9J7V1_9PSEU|nr:asparaginase [Actinomycetospora corticicola]NYD38603.1 L-asparaginase II [Actinomycetospora corticicola]